MTSPPATSRCPPSPVVLHTAASATGTIARQADGRHIQLKLHIRDGRNEDLLTLLTRSRPVVQARLSLDAGVDIPAPPLSRTQESLILRMTAAGTASLDSVLWTNPEIQRQMDALSVRANGHAAQAADHPDSLPVVPSTITGRFNLANADIAIANLVYTMPGATILMDGHYPLIAQQMEFHGVARTVATADKMETGIKSLLLKPLSPLLKKNGAGIQVPVTFSGDKSNPTLSLDLTHRSLDKTVSRQNPETPHR